MEVKNTSAFEVKHAISCATRGRHIYRTECVTSSAIPLALHRRHRAVVPPVDALRKGRVGAGDEGGRSELAVLGIPVGSPPPESVQYVVELVGQEVGEGVDLQHELGQPEGVVAVEGGDLVSVLDEDLLAVVFLLRGVVRLLEVGLKIQFQRE